MATHRQSVKRMHLRTSSPVLWLLRQHRNMPIQMTSRRRAWPDPTSRQGCYLNVTGNKFLLVIANSLRFPIVEELPLKTLLAAQLVSESYEPGPGEPANETGPLVRLTFEPANQEHAFVMYDKADLNKLLDLLSPFIEARRITLECMKCGERFDESCAQHKVKLTRNATDVPIGFNKESLTEVPFCPKCHSDIVLQVPSSDPTSTRDSSHNVVSNSTLLTANFPRIQSVVFGDSRSASAAFFRLCTLSGTCASTFVGPLYQR
jgi:hypothetical protein